MSRVRTPNAAQLAGHSHGEAFMLMEYVCVDDKSMKQHMSPPLPGCGHKEIIWNSRDGVTPFGTNCPSCGGSLMHINWSRDRYAPDHKLHYGQGFWRDGTPDEAEAIMRRRIASCVGTAYEVKDPAYAEQLIKAAREPDQHSEFQKGWPMFERHGYKTDLEKPL